MDTLLNAKRFLKHILKSERRFGATLRLYQVKKVKKYEGLNEYIKYETIHKIFAVKKIPTVLLADPSVSVLPFKSADRASKDIYSLGAKTGVNIKSVLTSQKLSQTMSVKKNKKEKTDRHHSMRCILISVNVICVMQIL